MTAIAVRGLWKEYGEQIVLERLDFDITSGAFVALVGPSGCGKTTFLRMILGEERPTRGKVTIDGRPLPDEPGPDRGVVFQRYSVFPHMTVLQNVVVAYEFAESPLVGRLFGAARRRAAEKARALIDRVGLGPHCEKFPRALSGGMQQRLAIAQALAKEPRILLLDEPFGALDPGTKTQIHGLVRELWRATGMTILMVTHDLREAFGLATRVLAFDKPRIDPQAPGRYGATITYDLPLERDVAVPVLGFQKPSRASPVAAKPPTPASAAISIEDGAVQEATP